MADALLTTFPIVEVADRPIVLHRGDLGREYASFGSGALVVDRTHRSRLRFEGPRARDMVTGLVTNDVAPLAAGHGLYAAALTPKGKVVADVRIFATSDSLLTDTAARAGAGWFSVARRYVNPRVTPYRDESATMADLGVFGARAVHVVSLGLGVQAAALADLAMYGHLEARVDDALVVVARVPDLGFEGFDVFLPVAAHGGVWARLVAAGGTPGGLAACEIARVEAGRPEWGIDLDETTIPQEANFDDLGAISYTKGCYTGQETVARLHFRGHVNRSLRGLRLGGDAVPPLHAPLFDGAGKAVGDVRSVVHSPRFGPIAIAMIRREIGPGMTVIVRWESHDGVEAGEIPAAVAVLPFSPLPGS